MTSVIAPLSYGLAQQPRSLLDELLDRICLLLQISDTQFEDAERRYHDVGRWLAGPGTPLGALQSRIYAQGSMRLRTTVKPRESRDEEYDLDIVFEIDDDRVGPLELYNAVRRRLEANDDYRARLTPLNRCLRLNYSGFHLDILPARRNPARIDGYIEVPDRELRAWHPSNPDGYAGWFERRCATMVSEQARAGMVEPLQAPCAEDLLATLRRSVQLIKRRRDNVFGARDDAPRSVVLTTLAGHLYGGQIATASALRATLDGIGSQVDAADRRGQRLVVLNPSRPDEDFSERWDDRPDEYQAFRRFIDQFATEIEQLSALEGMEEQAAMLNQMFGHGIGTRAADAYMRDMARAKASRNLGHIGPAIVVGRDAGRPNAPHTFHHAADRALASQERQD